MKNYRNTTTYRQLALEDRIATFEKYQALCEEYEEYVPFSSFEEYDAEQEMLNFEFDADTLDCLG